jgi:DnaJ-class molecular chaperone
LARVDELLKTWQNDGCSKEEITRRIIDLFFVSVLLDAGAGDSWSFIEPKTGNKYERSEGIAVASLYMFKEGAFSDSKDTTVTSMLSCSPCHGNGLMCNLR